ncbi:MAG TPA: hypothetical protein PLR26_06990 [Bacilli bacterium]|nr:hypothetical protein [Bacilli bacterium]
MLSGGHFQKYPGIFIKRSVIEKQNYINTQILNIDIYFFHSLLPYEDYIKAFFEPNNLLFEQYYQIISFKKMILKEGSAFSGTIKVETPLQRVEDLAIQIEYYNHTYQTTFIIPTEVQWINKNHIVDERYHTMNRVRFQLGGNIGTMKVNNLDKALFYIGIGKTNFIGGGTISEIKD